jgi:hypothetical protein
MILNKPRSKIILLFTLVLLSFQSCKSYHREAVTIDEAVESHKKVRVTRINGETIRLTKIESENSIYYGIDESSRGIAKILLDPKDIEKIQLKDPGISVVGFVLLGMLAIVLVISVLFLTY